LIVNQRYQRGKSTAVNQRYQRGKSTAVNQRYQRGKSTAFTSFVSLIYLFGIIFDLQLLIYLFVLSVVL
jgi:hypothetical protein